jgi:formylglycine-generating enzyme required for sulfatase activity
MERGVAPAKLSDMVGAAWNWCLDPKVFDKNYTWPDLNAPLGDYLDAVNTKDNRTVCIKPLGAATVWEWKGTPQPIDTQGYIYDFLSSARSCSNATITGYFRKIKE